MKYPWLFLLLVVCMLLVLYAAAQRVIQVIDGTPQTATTEQPATPQTPVVTPQTATASPVRPSATAAFSPTSAASPRASTPTPSTVFSPTPIPTAVSAAVQGYIAYRVKDGESLADIAARAGSDAALIRAYNRFDGEVHAQQPLIIPQTDRASASISSQSIIVQRGTKNAAVALTLDAGASAAPTTAILDALAARDVQITFFLSGDWIVNNPELTRRIIADGHEVGNHSVSHPDFRLISDEQIGVELDGMSDALYAAAGVRPAPYLRPPYGSYDERVLRAVIARGYLPIFWTLDSLDAFGEVKTADFIIDRLTNTLSESKRNGAILLAHCGNQTTADALPRILDRFAQMGVLVTTLSKVL
jgi:peptidoglycan/xylan/chitin deacetylase (PgdA/CDA1 family)